MEPIHSHRVARFPRPLRFVKSRQPIALATLLIPGFQADAEIEVTQSYDYSYQLYQEDDDRMRIEAHYIRGQFDFNEATTFRFQWLNDAISGASPTGLLPGTYQPFYANVEDVRTGILGALAHKFGDHRVELEVSRSEEDDYLSYGFALSDAWELNQKNTVISYGLNYLDDTVSVPALGDRKKNTYDLFAGVTQIIDKNTLITANLTLGFSEGYLNDPYKLIQRDEILDPGGLNVPLINVYRENRPDSRFRQVLQFEGKRYFEDAKGALDAVLRFSHDDYGVFSQTLQIEWRQEVGEHFEVTPFARYYHQSSADFFMNTLNGVRFPTPSPDDPRGAPPTDPNGSGTNYSSDYRLSSLDAISLGLRLRYQFNDHFAVNAAYERYMMDGSGSDSAPDLAYPSANIWTVGVNFDF